MKWIVMPIVALSLMLTGCAGQNDIWILLMPNLGGTTCETNITHNFIGASVPGDPGTQPGPWTYDQTDEGSPDAMFVQIFSVGGRDESKVMLLDDVVLFGAKEGGAWTFSWESWNKSEETESHESGYTYKDTYEESVSSSITLDFSGSSATGTFAVTYDDTETWDESDMWDPNLVGRANGQIPSGWYLEDANQNAVENLDDNADCTGSPCNLVVNDVCSTSAEIEGNRTNYDNRAYDSVAPAGLP